MADTETENLLKKLGLEALIKIFKENNINQRTMRMLDKEMIKELIKDIGSRAIFLDYMENNFCQTVKDLNDNKRKRQDSVKANPSEANKFTKHYIFRSIDEILNEDVEGRRILTYFSTHGKLLEKHRNKMCHMLLIEAERKKMKVDYELAAFMADSIEKRFDGEVSSTYFKAPVKKCNSASNESEPACGKIISIRNNRKSAETKFNKMLEKDKKNNASVPQNPDGYELVISDEVKEALTWLQENRQPWRMVLQKWELTTGVRIHYIKNLKDTNLAEIFKKWELYEHPSGAELIKIDFKAGKYTKIQLNFGTWMDFVGLVREYTEENQNDNTVFEYSEVMDSTDEKIGEDQKVAVSLMALSHMASPRLTKKFSAKSAWKASTESAKATMIVNPQKAGEVSAVRREVREQAAKRQESVQPYIIIVGKLKDITDIFVNVDDTMYQVDSVLDAIDICFQAFFVFQLKYPYDSQHLWLMIQRGLYRIQTDHDNILPP
ncbi:hypothetical protein QAD02_020544 [Eretmocerus hayati]|uniref:Uncharacterized protein n=1 Tax=Eretmocerus hayati TaxID=131215 RepID=A0ACC2PP01_9HYME|nr:hypothetical protein QAD02_020544 [Eretmocerus hayati]